MLSLSTAILALGLTAAADARALGKKGLKWDACPELNKNVTELTATLLLGPAEPFECGKLSVPLDYTDPDSPPLDLDLFRVKATKEPVLGTVLYNPGGPGGNAGLNFPSVASDLRASVGEQYHLLSWDPRGTGYTIPFVCSPTEDAGAAASRKRDVPTLSTSNTTDLFLNGGWQGAGDYAALCRASNNGTGSLIGTAFLARDMLQIVDSLGEDGLLRYYGHSYGTVLGSYFAAMFPDRVERMVLDANLDPADYRDGSYGDNIIDSDKTFFAFLEACFANKDDCALATFVNANCTRDLFDAVDLYAAQMAAKAVDLATYSKFYASFKQPILQGLYFPSQWPALAKTIVTFLSTSTDDASTDADADADAESDPETEAVPWSYGVDVSAGIGIRGSDATFKPTSAERYLPTLETQVNASSFADVWYSTAWISAQWKLPAKERFDGEFAAKTKHPILYVNGEYDPVTPLVHAHRASKGFEGSVVLSHSGFGHGVFADPSTCVHDYTRAFFKYGVLPEEGAHCEPDVAPWELAKIRNGTAYGALPSIDGEKYLV